MHSPDDDGMEQIKLCFSRRDVTLRPRVVLERPAAFGEHVGRHLTQQKLRSNDSVGGWGGEVLVVITSQGFSIFN